MTRHIGPGPSTARRAVLAALACWVAAPARAQTPPRSTPALAGTAIDRCKRLIELSAELVETARSAQGAASSFRIDVVHYRESLRALMKDDAKQPAAARLPKPLLMDMVRMVALLQSAAECQTGRYIVCPADLIAQLDRQQKRAADGMARLLPAKA